MLDNNTIKNILTSLFISGVIFGGVVNGQNTEQSQGFPEYQFPPIHPRQQNQYPINNHPVNRPMMNGYSNYRPTPQMPMMPYNQANPNQQNFYQQPYNPYNRPYNGNAYNYVPQNPYNQGAYRGNPYYRQGPNNNSFGPFGGGNPFNNFSNSPFNNNNAAPWESWPFGGQDSFWNRKELPFKNQNPTDWFKPGDPKEGIAIMWDDVIAAPDDLGTMPGGWHVPSVSVPNPIDLEDQLEQASKEIPDLIRVYSD
jgi:hypothetical protein